MIKIFFQTKLIKIVLSLSVIMIFFNGCNSTFASHEEARNAIRIYLKQHGVNLSQEKDFPTLLLLELENKR
jgi:hypothetical protein